MNKKAFLPLAFLLALGSCTYLYKGSGQVVYHWERDNTGVQKFSTDHTECLNKAKEFKLWPDFRTWFYSEETKLNTRADWHADKGIWASYVPYPGAQPLMVNSRRNDEDVNPIEYRKCMESKGYWNREHDIPEITNINLHHYEQPRRYPIFAPPPFGDD